MCTGIKSSAPENPALKSKASIPITWVSKPEIQATVPRNQDQGVCCHRQMPETSTVRLESGLRCLKSRQICTEIRTSVPENPGLKIKASIPITWVSMPEM